MRNGSPTDSYPRATARRGGGGPSRAAALLAAAVLLLAGACRDVPERGGEAGGPDTAAAASEAPRPVGRLVLVGGALADENEDVYRAILRGRSGDGPLCVLPTASGRPRRSMEAYVGTFDSYGGDGTARGVFLTMDDVERARSAELARTLRACSGFFFTGGSQSRIVDVFLPEGETTRTFRTVRERYLEGAVVAGSSAGAAVMGDPMIAGGSSRGALRHGIRASEDGDGVWLRRGFGFFGPGLVDQHFLARGRVARLVVATVRTSEVDWGFGIDENTALVVDGREARVVGASGVLWVDAADIVGGVEAQGATGIRLHLLGEGDRLDLVEGRVVVPAGKAPAPTAEPAVEPPGDPFGEWAFLGLLAGLAASPDAAVGFTVAGYRFDLEEADDFRARAYGPGGVRGTPRGLSAGPMRLDVVRPSVEGR